MPKLEILRAEIAQIDHQIIQQLAERQKRVLAIGQLKAQTGRAIRDVAYEKQLLKHYEELSAQQGLNVDYIKRIFKVIMHFSRQSQQL